MIEQTLARARACDEDAFRELTDPYRRELQLHAYRIVGSVHDAEDLLQETLLAAWRGLEQFQGRASVRAWVYRIATNRSLDALRASKRRPKEERMPQMPEPTRWGEPVWLEPYPDVLLEGVADDAPGPDARHETKEAIALAFVVGLQHLPPQQRAVLVLRDVLGYRAAEVAATLETSETSVNSLLRRARAAFESRLPATGRERAPLPNSKLEREIARRSPRLRGSPVAVSSRSSACRERCDSKTAMGSRSPAARRVRAGPRQWQPRPDPGDCVSRG